MDEVIANKHVQVLIPPDSAGRAEQFSRTHHDRVARVFSVQSPRPRLTCPEPCPELGNSEANSENSHNLRSPQPHANVLQSPTL